MDEPANDSVSSFRDQIISDILHLTEESISILHKNWKETGTKDERIKEYLKQVRVHIKDLYNEMVVESEHQKKELLRSVQQLMEETQTLSKELRTDVVMDGYEDLPLLTVKVKLQNQVESLQLMKNQRLKYLEEFLAKEEEICKALGVQPMGISTDLPTEEELRSLKIYLEKQEAEKQRLEDIFKELRQSIMLMMDELHISPSLDFERTVCNNSRNFVLNANNMSSLRDLRDRLVEQVEEAKQQAEEKRDELLALWKYLEEPQHVCDAFLETYPGYSVTTLNALKQEIKRCKDKRSENIAKYVGKVRAELEEMWDQCKYSESQRRAFLPIHSQTFTEDLLTLHELEVTRLRQFYKDNRKIFELLDERESLWENMKKLEERANDPDRFHNRGGQLLEEEKQRKILQKKLPKIEDELNALVNEYELMHGEAFTINGMPLAELLKQSWDEYDEAKHTMKMARKQAKDQTASGKKMLLSVPKHTPGMSSMRQRTPGTSSIRQRTPGTSSIRQRTPLNSMKRKLPSDATPKNSSNKKRNISGSDKPRRSVAGYKTKKNSRVSRKIFNHSGNRSNSDKKAKGTSQKDPQSSTLSISSYGEFQNHLEERDELRSSVIPEKHLRSATKKSGMRTPVKTPVKPLRKNLSTATTPNRTFNRTPHGTPRSPRTLNTPRLVTAPSELPFIF